MARALESQINGSRKRSGAEFINKYGSDGGYTPGANHHLNLLI